MGIMWVAVARALSGDLHQYVAAVEHLPCDLEVFGEDALQFLVGGVPARQPDDLGRSAQTLLQLHKVAVFGEHNGAGSSRRIENILVLRIAQAQIAQWRHGDAEGFRKPSGNPGRQLSVHPERHAASTG